MNFKGQVKTLVISKSDLDDEGIQKGCSVNFKNQLLIFGTGKDSNQVSKVYKCLLLSIAYWLN